MVWAAPLGLALTTDYRGVPTRPLLLGYSQISSGREWVSSSSFILPVPSVREEVSACSPAPFTSSVGCSLSSMTVLERDREQGNQGALFAGLEDTEWIFYGSLTMHLT